MPATIVRLRIVAAAAVVSAALVLLLAGAGRHIGLPTPPWWYDRSQVSAAMLEHLEPTLTPAQRNCVASGGQPIAGTCAIWDEAVLPNGTVASAVSTDTVTAPGASIVNNATPGTTLGLPPSAVWATLAFVAIAAAVALRSTWLATWSLISTAQTWRTNRQWLAMFEADDGLWTQLTRSRWLSLYDVIVGPMLLAIVAPAAIWLIVQRYRDLRRRFRSGQSSETGDRVREFAAAILRTPASSNGPNRPPNR